MTAGANGVLDSVGSSVCPTSVDAFCNSGTALINGLGDAAIASPYAGSEVILDAGASSLDQCVNGSIQFELRRCNTNTINGPCDAPANATVIQGFSSDKQYRVFPTEDVRYRVTVRCSSQSTLAPPAACRADTDILILVYPADKAGAIDI